MTKSVMGSPEEHAFQIVNTKLNTERQAIKQQLQRTAAKAWQSISKEETAFGDIRRFWT